MGRDFTNFERSLKESIEGYEVPYNEAQWNDLTQKMDGKKASSVSTIAASVVTALILAGGAYYFASQNSTSQNSNIPENSTENITQTQNDSEQTGLTDNSLTSIENSEDDNSASIENIAETNESASGNSNETSALIDSQITTNSQTARSNSQQSKKQQAEEVSVIAQENSSVTSSTSDAQNTIEESVSNDGLTSTTTTIKAEKEKLMPSMSVSNQSACAGEPIHFKAENIDPNQNFLWNFGNGDFSTDMNPERTFEVPGSYNVTLILSGVSQEVQSLITIHPKPTAKFTAQLVEPGEVVLKNQSENADKCNWLLDDQDFSNDINPVHTYTQGGAKHVTLRVENEFGCSDTQHKDVLLTAPYNITDVPTELVVGKAFKPTLNGVSSEVMSLQIMNLNSQLIFETISDSPTWDGTLPDGTYPAPGSEFVWLIKVLDANGSVIADDSAKFKIIP